MRGHVDLLCPSPAAGDEREGQALITSQHHGNHASGLLEALKTAKWLYYLVLLQVVVVK